MNLNKIGLWFGLTCSLLIACNCRKGNLAASTLPAETNPRQAQQKTVAIDREPYSESDPQWLKQAWDRFTANDVYRVPDSSEFGIPEAAILDNYHRIDIENAIRKPYLKGDFNQDGFKPDLIVTVVASNRNDSSRFGIVIFNAPQDSQSLPTVHWLIKERDLSATVISAWSGGASLITYLKNGQSKGCFIDWDNRSGGYLCNEKSPQSER